MIIRKKMHKVAFALLMAGVLSASAASAVDLAPGLTMKGFGTVGAVNSSTDAADYTNSFYLQAGGAGRTARTSLTPDSRVGVQFDWKALDRLTLVTQFISKQTVNNSFAPSLEWAYAKYAVSGDLDVRIGRIRPPLYMLSDYLDVNYANPWVRPPQEVYAVNPISRMEGVDLLWRPSLGDYSFLVQPYFGTIRRKNLNLTDTTLQGHDVAGLNATVSKDSLTLRAGYAQAHTQLITGGADLQVFPALATICALTQGADGTACGAYAQLQSDDRLSSFSSLGFNWDNGDWVVSGEGAKRTMRSYGADLASWYLSAGKRIGKWTPYATYSSVTNESPTSVSSGVFPGIPAYGLPSTNYLLTALLLGNYMDQHTVSLGVRYDLTSNLSLKGQWDRVSTSTKNGQPGTGVGLFNFQTATSAFANASNNVNLLSLSLDFVF